TYQLDHLRVKMILNNLVSNSIKYRDRTREQSTFELSIQESQNNIEIIAQDNGVGIDEESLPKIYDMFYRIAEDDMGSGIGLYIVKEAIDKMGGSITVESEPGKGCKFTIILPVNS
ncbi:MAG: sensor histidine kinase, partial [Flavobacteriales bacterium]